jgi:hypothetical protein
MTTASLTRLTVPVASDANPPSQGLLMPKLKYRFRVTFQGLGISQTTTELTKQVISFTRPSVTFENIDLPVYNSTIRLAGKHSWQDVTCEVRDDAGGNVSRLVGEQLQKQLDFMEQSSAASGIDYKFSTTFEVLDGGNGANAPVVLESWYILGCYLQGVNYNDSNYGSNEPMTVSMTMRYDNALQTLTGADVGVGADYTRPVSGGVAAGGGVPNASA